VSASRLNGDRLVLLEPDASVHWSHVARTPPQFASDAVLTTLFGFYEDAPARFRLVPTGPADAAASGLDQS